MVFVCHVILQCQVIKALNDFIISSPLKVCHHPSKFDSHKHCGSVDMIVLVCYLILTDHEIKGSCGFMGRSLSR